MADDDRNRQIGEAVRKVRGDLPQEALAEAMRKHGHEKWSQSTVWSVETGARPLRLTEAVDLAHVLEVDVERLVRGWDEVAEAEWQVLQAEIALAQARHTLMEREKEAEEAKARLMAAREGAFNG